MNQSLIRNPYCIVIVHTQKNEAVRVKGTKALVNINQRWQCSMISCCLVEEGNRVRRRHVDASERRETYADKGNSKGC